MSEHKIAIIGAGAVGATIAYTLTVKNLAAQIVLIDVNEQKEAGEVMDIGDAMCLVETGCIKGGDFKDAADADIIIITAGLAQKPGETRLDLIKKNKEIMKSIFAGMGRLKSEAIVVIISNPVDVLTYLAQEISGLPKNQVFGSGTTLDTIRLRAKVGKALGISPQNIHGYVLGEHGDSEFVAWSTVTAGGVPVNELENFNEEMKAKIEDEVGHEAYEIIQLKGATFYGISLAASEIVEAIFYNQNKILPLCSRLNGWNGIKDICLGAPTIVGQNGVIDVWPLELERSEKKLLAKSAKILKEYVAGL